MHATATAAGVHVALLLLAAALVLPAGADRTASAAGTCSAAAGVQLGSWEIEVVTSAKTLADCCAACGAEPRCAAFQFSPGHCTLQGNVQNMGPGDGSYLAPAQRPPLPSGYNTACRGQNAATNWPFCNTSLSHDERLDDLVARINMSEAGSQLTARQSSALPRLGIPSYYYGTNVLHGFREAGCVTGEGGAVHCPTSWPTPPNMGAAFNRSLSAAMGRSFGTELRAMYNVRAVNSLDTWSPTINLARDPRWGRIDETPSEDPYILGQHALHSVLGAQNGPDPVVPMVGVTLKHWLANSVEGGVGKFTRETMDAQISAYDLASTYLPGFETPITQGNALGIMCSYNSVSLSRACLEK
jgi:hypothetical protein